MPGTRASGPDVAIVGAGAIGGCVAARLYAARRMRTVLCVRRPFEQLRVEGPAGTFQETPLLATDPREMSPVPWVIVATKAHQTPGAAGWLRALTDSQTVVAILQNGVEHEERVQPYVNRATLLPVVVECPAVQTAPGRVTQRGDALLTVPSTPAGHCFAALFAGTDVAVKITEDFATAAWQKLCLNVAGGAISVLTDSTLGIVRFPDVARLARDLIRECVQVGRAEGATLDDNLADEIVSSMQRGPMDAGTSMLTDHRAGRVLEADARNGAVVRLGARHGIDTPLNRAVNSLLSAMHRDLPPAPG